MHQNPIAPSELIINADGSVYHLGLRPEELADIVLTVGDPDRVESVAQHLTNREFTHRRREFVSTTGWLGNKRITVLSTGMGTDNVEIVMNELDALANIDLTTRLPKSEPKSLTIIRIGTSGALQDHIQIDDVLASHVAIGGDSLMCYYDLPQSAAELAAGQAVQEATDLPFTPYVAVADAHLLSTVGQGMVAGTTLTCPGFYAPQGRSLRLMPKQGNLVAAYAGARWTDEVGTAPSMITNFEMETAGYYALAKLLGHAMLSVNAIVAHRTRNVFSTQADDTIQKAIRLVLEGVQKL